MMPSNPSPKKSHSYPYLSRNLVKVVKKCITQRLQSSKKSEQDLIELTSKVKKSKVLKLHQTISDQKYSSSHQTFYCVLCRTDYGKQKLEYFIHLLFFHREYGISVKLHQIISWDKGDNSTYLAEVECTPRNFRPKSKKMLSDEQTTTQTDCYCRFFFKKAPYSRYIRIKHAFQKAFSLELTDNSIKKRVLESRLSYQSYGESETDEEYGDTIYSKEEIVNLLKDRTFFHSYNTFKKIQPNELFVESEDEIEDNHAEDIRNEALDDFLDISKPCIEFYKMWNNFVKNEKRRCQRNKEVYFCRADYKKHLVRFLDERKSAILANSLRYPFVMHLFTLQTYNFIDADCILEILSILDKPESNKKSNSPV